MPSLRRVVRCIPCSIIFLAACASAGERRAVEEPAAKPGLVVESARVSSPTAQIELSRRPAWRTFQARYGDWKVLWNEDTGTPHRAFGNSIPLRSFANDPAAVEHAVRAFIAQNPAVFQAPTLETAAVYREGDVWYVRFQQTLRGLPVLNSDWEFRVGTNGRLMMFGADARTVSAGFDATPRVVGAVAREAGHLGLAFNAATDRTQGADRLYLLPVRGPDGSAQLRPVYRVEVVTRRPVGSWQSWVDAQTGEVLQRRSLMDHAISGQVTATVHLKLPTDAVTTKPLADAWVNVGTVLDTTDTSGNYSANPPTSPVCVTSRFAGPYCSIFRQDAADASFSRCGVANPSSGVNIVWNSTNSDDAERDCFYHVNLAHDHIKAIDPSYVASDYSLSVFVNYLDGTDCEAYWDQPSNSLNFWPSVTDGTCPSTGTMPDIIWHEYCHSVTYNLYFSHGAALGCQNATLREGMADAFSALMDDDPIIGNGWSGVGTYLRDISIDRRWPDDLTSDPEQSGAIFAGALWDVRQAIGRSKTDSLYHFAKYGLPDDGDDGIAMNEFFVDMLVTDDNNGNLGDGTPHMSQIVTAFNNHGIGTNFFIQATHAPQDDQISVGPFPITATIQYNGPFGSLSLAELFYSFNGGAYAEQPMLPTGNPDEYGAEIPRLAFGIVSYYLLMQDSFGGTTVLPSGAPARSAYQFVVGPTSVLLYYDMETNPGWTVGASKDSAISGIWTRVVPAATIAQPGVDHTPTGTMCWVTGNLTDPQQPGLDDVDEGRTTLTTNTFSAAGASVIHPIISYWQWYSNNIGDFTDEDPWQVDISSNGGTNWTHVVYGATSTIGWQRVVFLIENFVTPSTNMKMRFVARDTLNPSLVEAAVDDWQLMAYSDLTGVDGPPVPSAFVLSPAFPNPFRKTTLIRYSLPATGHVELRIFDITGRAVRTLVAEAEPAGPRTVEWNGRDDAGRLVANGPYFLRLSQAGRVQSRAVVMLR